MGSVLEDGRFEKVRPVAWIVEPAGILGLQGAAIDPRPLTIVIPLRRNLR